MFKESLVDKLTKKLEKIKHQEQKDIKYLTISSSSQQLIDENQALQDALVKQMEIIKRLLKVNKELINKVKNV